VRLICLSDGVSGPLTLVEKRISSPWVVVVVVVVVVVTSNASWK